MKNRTIAIITLLAFVGLGAAGCNSGKNAANNAAQTAASAGGAMASAANNAVKTASSAGAAAGSSAQNAMGNAANGAANAMTGKPNCGAVQPVWVNLKTKVYHEPGDPAYGNTKHGEYLCPSQATAQGFHAAGGAMRHRKKTSM